PLVAARLSQQRHERVLDNVVGGRGAAHVQRIAVNGRLMPRIHCGEGLLVASPHALEQLAIVHLTNVLRRKRGKVPPGALESGPRRAIRTRARFSSPNTSSPISSARPSPTGCSRRAEWTLSSERRNAGVQCGVQCTNRAGLVAIGRRGKTHAAHANRRQGRQVERPHERSLLPPSETASASSKVSA